jgi:hypothetical protein
VKQAKLKTKQKKKEAKRKRNRFDTISSRIFIAGLILFLLLMILSPRSIGYDSRFIVFIILLPIALGTIPLLIYQSKITEAWIGTSNYKETLWEKILFQGFYFLCSAFFAFSTISVPAQIGFEIANFYTAKGNKQETIIVPVDEFHEDQGKSDSDQIRFHFNNHYESINVSEENTTRYIIESATKHRIKLKLRKGLWNYYVIVGYNIIK